MARSAMLSRFHFARVFEKETGVPPGRFLGAVRIYQAKRLLLARDRPRLCLRSPHPPS